MIPDETYVTLRFASNQRYLIVEELPINRSYVIIPDKNKFHVKFKNVKTILADLENEFQNLKMELPKIELEISYAANKYVYNIFGKKIKGRNYEETQKEEWA